MLGLVVCLPLNRTSESPEQYGAYVEGSVKGLDKGCADGSIGLS